MRIEHTDTFAVPPEALWPWLEDPDKQAQWMTGMVSNELLDAERSQAGAHFRMKIKEGGKVATYEGQITTFDPPRHLAITFAGGSFPKGAQMVVDYKLTPDGQATRLDYTAAMDTSQVGALMRMFLPMAVMFAKAQLRSFLANLHRCVEG